MTKIMRLTERDLTKLVSRVINEQKHPVDSQLWKNMLSDIQGDGVTIVKETPNQLMIQGVTGDWTITYNR